MTRSPTSWTTCAATTRRSRPGAASAGRATEPVRSAVCASHRLRAALHELAHDHPGPVDGRLEVLELRGHVLSAGEERDAGAEHDRVALEDEPVDLAQQLGGEVTAPAQPDAAVRRSSRLSSRGRARLPT